MCFGQIKETKLFRELVDFLKHNSAVVLLLAEWAE